MKPKISCFVFLRYFFIVSMLYTGAFLSINEASGQCNAFAGRDIFLCGTEGWIEAILDENATGEWTIESEKKDIVIENKNNPLTYIRNLHKGIHIFRWTVTYESGCVAFDEMTVDTRYYFNSPEVDDIELCSEKVTVKKTIPNGCVSELLQFTRPKATIANPYHHKTQISNLENGVLHHFLWHVYNEHCEIKDTFTVLNNLVQAEAGPNQVVCTKEFQLSAGQIPEDASGHWECLTEPANVKIFSPNQSHSKVKTQLQGNLLFEWQVIRGTCSSTDRVRYTKQEITTNAGNNVEVCTWNAGLRASKPSGGFAGRWLTQNQETTFSNPTYFKTTAQNLKYGKNTFTWQITRDQCTVTDDVVVNCRAADAFASEDHYICQNEGYLIADEPMHGLGLWTTKGSAVIKTPTAHKSIVEIKRGDATFFWTVKNEHCTMVDTVRISNQKVTADAGDYLFICQDSVVMKATEPEAGTGIWTLDLGNLKIEDVNSPSTKMTNITRGMHKLIWSVKSDKCEATDFIYINNYMLEAFAEVDDTIICVDNVNIKSSHIGNGEGHWEFTRGNGKIINEISHRTYLDELKQGDFEIAWIVSNTYCTDTAKADFHNDMIVSSVMDGRLICKDFTTLSATVSSNAQGLWYHDSSAVIMYPDSTHTPVNDLVQGASQFIWQTQSAYCSETDTVIIHNNQVSADAGKDISTCTNKGIIEALKPDIGTGKWIAEDNSVLIDNPGKSKTEISNLSRGENSIIWKVTNRNCLAYDTLIVTNKSFDTDAGENQIVCSTQASLKATMPNGSIGYWNGSGAQFAQKNAPLTIVSDLKQGDNTLVWTVEKDGCRKEKSVTISNKSVEANAGNDTITCQDTVFLSAILPEGTNGQWNVSAGNIGIRESQKPETYAYNLPEGQLQFLWQVSNEHCKDKDTLTIERYKPIKKSFSDTVVCNNSFVLQTDSAENITWSVVEGNGYISDTHTHVTNLSDLSNGLNTIHLEAGNNFCSDTRNFDIFYRKIIPGLQYESLDEEFSYQFSVNPETDSLQITWDFGDKKTSHLPYPVHTYPSYGLYEVTLSVEDTIFGCSGSEDTVINAGNIPCEASFNYVVDSADNEVSFFDNSFGQINTWTWEFGDSAVSYDENPVHMFERNQLYTIKLTIENDQTGCKDSEIQIINFSDSDKLKGDFTFFADTSFTKEGVAVFFSAASNRDNVIYKWSPDDTTEFLTQAASIYHIYQNSAKFDVCLDITDTITEETITLCKELSIGELTQIKSLPDRPFSFFVYPNPVNENTALRLSLKQSSYINIHLYNLSGQPVASVFENKFLRSGEHLIPISTQSLLPGIYFIKIYSPTFQMVKKIVKTKK